MKRLGFVLILMLAGVGVALVQPLQNPWHRPMNPQGGSAGITYGTLAPSLATIGMNPGQGELWLDTDGATDGGPILNVFDHVTGVWDTQLSSAALTAPTIPVFNGIELIDSTVTDDQTDVVATGGLFTAGSAVDAADSILLDGNNDTLQFEGGTADGAEVIFVAVDPDTDLTIRLDNPAASSDGDWMELAAALAQQDAGNVFRGLYVNITSPVNHLGAASVIGLDLDNDVDTALGEEVAIHFTPAWDAELHFAADQATVWWLDTGSLLIQDYGGAIDFILDDMPDHGAADVAVAAMELDIIMDIMDAGDVQSGLFIDVTNAVHTGGTLYGLNIDGIVAQGAEETAIFVGATWDIDVHFGSATALVNWFETGVLEISDYGQSMEFILSDTIADDTVGATDRALVEIDPTLGILNDAGDITRVLHLDIDNVNHSNGTVYGIDLDMDAGDANATEVALNINAAWDYDVQYTTQMYLHGSARDSDFVLTDSNLANNGADYVWMDNITRAMNGGDTIRSLYIDTDSGAHTGFVNKLIGIELDTLVADVNVDEIGIVIEEGYETGVQSAGRILVRESFEQPFIVLEEDYTAKALVDNAVNTVQGSPSGIIDYMEEQNKAASSWVIADGDLDISADNGAANDEGVEIILGDDDDATSGWLVSQTDTLCFTVNATTTLIAGTDQFVIGWRTSEAFDGGLVVANYTTFAYVGQTNIDGSVFMFVDDGDTANDDSGVNIANGSTNTYKVCMEADGGAAAYLNDTEITNTNTTAQLIPAGTNMYPFINYLCVNGTDAAILIHYWEITGT